MLEQCKEMNCRPRTGERFVLIMKNDLKLSDSSTPNFRRRMFQTQSTDGAILDQGGKLHGGR